MRDFYVIATSHAFYANINCNHEEECFLERRDKTKRMLATVLIFQIPGIVTLIFQCVIFKLVCFASRYTAYIRYKIILKLWRLKFNGSVASSLTFCGSLTAEVVSLENVSVHLKVRLFSTEIILRYFGSSISREITRLVFV